MTVSSDFRIKYGPFALVTGASSGIGAEFARQLARRGLSIVLVARRQEKLKQIATELQTQHAIQAKVIVADLSTHTGVQTVIDSTADIDIGLLINNAGLEQAGSFLLDDADRHASLLALNVCAVTALAHAMGRRMVDRGRGGILFVSSLARDMLPWMSVYSASKAYVSSLAVLLREEFRGTGIQVMAFEPGLVVSEMSERVKDKIDFAKVGFRTLGVSDCVEKALKSFCRGKLRETPGLMYKLLLFFTGILPTGMAMRLKGIMMGHVVAAELMNYPRTEGGEECMQQVCFTG